MLPNVNAQVARPYLHAATKEIQFFTLPEIAIPSILQAVHVVAKDLCSLQTPLAVPSRISFR